MAKQTIAELRAEIKRLKAERRTISTRGRLESELRSQRHKRAKQTFAYHVGTFVRAGHNFKEAVRLAKKAYRKLP